ncbi:MAG TPA: RES family NAD+ phosphorylase [Allosphingosinicella sp.]|nr:RES family NAD+ phosphorylase [Allosphingosinicella sp.]
MADDRHTAIAEVRPWIGSLVSVAYLKTVRDLAIVDCRTDDGRIHFYFDDEPSLEKREAAVWTYVARAFRDPVLRDDDRADYAPTQMIVELFQEQGYDGVIYPSAFGSSGSNLVLFDISAAAVVSCELHEVKDVKLDTKEVTNPYFVQKNDDGSTDIVRTVITAIGPIGGPMIDLRTGHELPEGGSDG